MTLRFFHPQGADLVGYIPEFLSPDDPRPAKEQFNDAYAHGGGWNPMEGWELLPLRRLKYPGDPPLKPVAELILRDETILVYPHAWVAIVQADGSFEVARMD